MDLRQQLALFRIETGKTLKTISEEAKISYSSLAKFNRGTINLSSENVNKLVTYITKNK